MDKSEVCIEDRHKNLRTVGEVIEALSKFEADMPVEAGLEEAAQVYRLTPDANELWQDPRGAIVIEGYDPTEDDEEEE